MTPPKTSTKPARGRDDAPTDGALTKALSHPLRWQILALLNEGTKTPAGIARQLGVRTENVSYHVRVLSDLGLIELVKTTPVRGALEHHYRARRRAFVSDADAEALPLHVRRDLSQGVVRSVIDDLIRGAADDAAYERGDAHISRTPLHVDEQGWNEINDLLAELLDRAMEIQAESMARTAEAGDEESLRSEVVLMHFPFVPRSDD